MKKIICLLIVLFSLCCSCNAEVVKFLQVTDIHLSQNNSQYLEQFVNDANTKFNDLDFIVFTGENIDKAKDKFLVDNQEYYIELTVSEADVMNSIIAAQKNATIFFVICIILFILGLIQVFSKLRNAFNKLEDSVVEVASGNLEHEIEIPKIGLLKELTLSIKKMVKRLKKANCQINPIRTI